MTEPIEHVDMKTFLEEIKPLQDEADKKALEAEEAKAKLVTTWQANINGLREKLQQGVATTGDQFLDEIVISQGWREEIVDALVRFNGRFVGVAGVEVLIIYDYEVERYHSMIPDGRSMKSRHKKYVWGILSGERLQLIKNGEGFGTTLKIPFTRYVKWGSDCGHADRDGVSRYEGAFSIEDSFSKENVNFSDFMRSLLERSNNPRFFFGEDILVTNTHLTPGCSSIWEKAKQLLHEAAPAEKLQGADI